MDFAELHIDPKFHRNIIGKNGQTINKLRDQYKVGFHHHLEFPQKWEGVFALL